MTLAPCGERRVVASFLLFLPVVLTGIAKPSFSRQAQPLQVTFEDAPGVSQASLAVGVVSDSALGIVEAVHTVWTSGGKVRYRSGRFGSLSRPQTLTPGPQASGDPVLFISQTGELTIIWAEERSPDPDALGRIIIVPGEWNLRVTHDPQVEAVWLNEDRGTPIPIPDRHPTMAGRNDSVLVVWERGTPSQIYYAFLTSNVSPLDARKIALVGYPLPGVRPLCASGASGDFWGVWTAMSDAGGDIWAARITGGGYAPPVPVRRGPEDDRSPAIAVDRLGRPHIVWQEGRNGGPIHYVYGFLGGGFSPIITLTPPGMLAQSPQILIPGDGVPRVLWQSAEGGLDMTMIFGTNALVPVTLILGEYNPRQRVEGVAELWPGIFVSSSGVIVTAFIAPDPVTQMRNVWVNFGTEESAALAVTGLVAEPIPSKGKVRLRWNSVTSAGVVRFEIRRRRVDEDDQRIRNVAAVAAEHGGNTFDALDTVDEAGRYLYRVDAVDEREMTVASASTTVDVESSVCGARIRAMPNPFNSSASLLIDVDRPTEMEAEIFTVAGHRVRALAQTSLQPGQHRVVWDGCDGEGRRLGSGLYYVRCRLTAQDGHLFLRTIPLTLLR